MSVAAEGGWGLAGRNRTVHEAFASASGFGRMSRRIDDSSIKSVSRMAGKRPRHLLQPCVATKGPRQQAETQAKTSQHQAEEKITVAINANLLQCCVCYGPLTPPLFHCPKGHVSCSGCCTEGFEDDEIECLICREPEIIIRCRAMEDIVTGLHVPCPFQQHGCVEMVPYGSEQAHKASCAHIPRHCPISGCSGYSSKPLREHVQQDHPGVVHTVVPPRCLMPLRMRAQEQARVVRLSDGGVELLILVREYKQLGRALSAVRLVDESVDKQDFKYRIEVLGKASVLSLSGVPLDAERLAEPYEASPFLFIPNEIWDSPEEYFKMCIQLK